MSGQWNAELQRYEVFSTLEGCMVPTGKNLEYRPYAGVDYCGYCKHGIDDHGKCNCDGHGGTPGNMGVCGYCHDEIFEDGCSCDGFGGEKNASKDLCRCGGKFVEFDGVHMCSDCRLIA